MRLYRERKEKPIIHHYSFMGSLTIRDKSDISGSIITTIKDDKTIEILDYFPSDNGKNPYAYVSFTDENNNVIFGYMAINSLNYAI